jgi:hypothetical protein
MRTTFPQWGAVIKLLKRPGFDAHLSLCVPVCFAGMRTVAFDGLNSLKIPDTDRNRCWIGRIWYRLAFAGYPTLRLMCLVETGT